MPRKVVAQKLDTEMKNFENHILHPINASSGIYRTINNKVVNNIALLIPNEINDIIIVYVMVAWHHFDGMILYSVPQS